MAFADFDEHFNLIGTSGKPVLGLGDLGCYDEHGVFPLNVIRTQDALLGYIGGWSRRVSVPIEGSIGLAKSDDDGVTFHRLGAGPVVTASLREPFMVGDPFVRIFQGTFHMWYIFGLRWQHFGSTAKPERIYKIGHAISSNGVDWVKEDEGRPIISDRLGADESQALPSVIAIEDRYHMFFCYRESFDFRTNPARAYRIGHAISPDLVNWARQDDQLRIDVTPNDWDSDMLCYPHLFEVQGDVYMMYNGNEFGRFGFGIAKLER